MGRTFNDEGVLLRGVLLCRHVAVVATGFRQVEKEVRVKLC